MYTSLKSGAFIKNLYCCNVSLIKARNIQRFQSSET